jgi:hypothetical protein
MTKYTNYIDGVSDPGSYQGPPRHEPHAADERAFENHMRTFDELRELERRYRAHDPAVRRPPVSTTDVDMLGVPFDPTEDTY